MKRGHENRIELRQGALDTYQLTAAGKKQLAVERSNWERLTAAMAGILNPLEGA